MTSVDDKAEIDHLMQRIMDRETNAELKADRCQARIDASHAHGMLVGLILGALFALFIGLILVASMRHASAGERWRQAQADGAPVCDEACQRASAWVRDLK